MEAREAAGFWRRLGGSSSRPPTPSTSSTLRFKQLKENREAEGLLCDFDDLRSDGGEMNDEVKC